MPSQSILLLTIYTKMFTSSNITTSILPPIIDIKISNDHYHNLTLIIRVHIHHYIILIYIIIIHLYLYFPNSAPFSAIFKYYPIFVNIKFPIIKYIIHKLSFLYNLHILYTFTLIIFLIHNF
jgi:hypothetical protein